MSDTHFGRADPSVDRHNESDLIRCIDSVLPSLDALYLVGDIFEHYIEYRHLVPKGYVRFQAMLARLTDAGTPVSYVVGNHDPWHIDYFRRELGVRVAFDSIQGRHFGRAVSVLHGDGLDDSSRLYNLLKPLLRHPVPVWIYRSLLPADAGVRLARWYSRTFRNEKESEPRVRALRRHARALLARHGSDVIVLGHSHAPEIVRFPEGVYLNPGCWYGDRILGLLDESGARLVRWTGAALEPIAPSGVDVMAESDSTA